MKLSVYFQNVNGLRTKTNTFFSNSSVCGSDVICVCETFLNSNVFDNEVFINSLYNVYRRDRDPTIGKSDGGGLMIAVSSTLKSYQRNWSSHSICEELWVSLELPHNKTLHICCTYIPPYTNYNDFFTHINYMSGIIDQYISDDFLIVGDYNFPKITWASAPNLNYLVPDMGYNDASRLFLDTLALLGLYQFNSVFNCNERILDLCISSKPNSVTVRRSNFPLVPEDTHHPALDISLDIGTMHFCKKPTLLYRDFKNADYVAINSALNDINWSDLFENKDVDYCTNIFYNKINAILNNFVPERCCKYKNFPKWFSSGTICIIKEKDKFHRRWKRFRLALDYQTFSLLRKRAKKAIKSDFKAYIANIQSSLSDNIKPFWSFINSKKDNSNRLPRTMKLNHATASDNKSICNLFSQYFASVFEPDNTPVNNSLVNGATLAQNLSFTINNFTEEDVEEQIDKLDIKKSKGPDDIPPLFVKYCKHSLIKPLLLLFNKSLYTGMFPSRWKIAKISPIFKKGDHSKIENYRPVSLLCIFGKLLEACVVRRLFFNIQSYIISEQHGFFNRRSVLTNLVPFIQYVTDCMDNRRQVSTVYTDFSKAFDKVHHPTLIFKLRKFGICGNLLRWIISYISNRSQYVAINNTNSEFIEITSGVPQGSHIGPILFSIFINDIQSCFKYSKFLLYADDLKIYKCISSFDHCVELQSDLNNLSHYCAMNKLFLNLDKCNFILFTRNNVDNQFYYSYCLQGILLKQVSEIKDLGIILDQKFTFNDHVYYVVRKALRNLGFIFRVAGAFTNPRAFIHLYYSLVRCHLEYASVVWNPQYNIHTDHLESVQKKFINRLNYKFNRRKFYESYTANLNFYNIISLRNRRILLDLIFVSKIVNGLVDAQALLPFVSLNVYNYNVRNPSLFYVPHSRTNSSLNSPMNRVLRCANLYLVNFDIFNLSVLSLKKYFIANLHANS